MTQPFTYELNRDASATIQGFLYQMQLTVLRWVDLDESTTLVCECREDVDHVSQLIENEEPTTAWLLEQIKKLKKPITLTSPEATEAVANFIGHCDSNPNANVRFRFTTTASVVRERRIEFPERWQGSVRGG